MVGRCVVPSFSGSRQRIPLPHLDGVNQVLDQEEAPQVAHGLVDPGQGHVAVPMDRVLRQSHLLVQVQPVSSHIYIISQGEIWLHPGNLSLI